MATFEVLARNCALNLERTELRDAVARKQKIDR
ncbi:unnamed protein product, partial [Strongylus vulgaris]